MHFDKYRDNYPFFQGSAIYSRKKSATPVMVMSVPMTSLAVMRCLLIMAYGTMISTGVSAIRVDAMPALAYWTAISDRDTPRKGPKKVVRAAKPMPLQSCSASRTCQRDLRRARMAAKPIRPKTARMKVPAKGISRVIAAGASAGPEAS